MRCQQYGLKVMMTPLHGVNANTDRSFSNALAIDIAGKHVAVLWTDTAHHSLPCRSYSAAMRAPPPLLLLFFTAVSSFCFASIEGAVRCCCRVTAGLTARWVA